jgi:hypothetical protein
MLSFIDTVLIYFLTLIFISWKNIHHFVECFSKQGFEKGAKISSWHEVFWVCHNEFFFFFIGFHLWQQIDIISSIFTPGLSKDKFISIWIFG